MIIVGFYKMPSYTLQVAGDNSIQISAKNIDYIVLSGIEFFAASNNLENTSNWKIDNK